MRLPGPERRPSPNHGPRRGGAEPDMVVLHYTGMADAASAIDRLADPAAEVSAHYVVTERGRIVEMVAEEARAWHAGVASWGGNTDVNSRSIGIEIVNGGHAFGLPPFPEPQMAAVEALLADIVARRAIRPERVVGHACIAPGRKRDPGEKFDWRRLALGGLAVWLDPEPGGAEGPPDAAAFRRAAAAFGYGVSEGEGWDAEALAVWSAFAGRFLPGHARAAPFAAGVAHLGRLARRWPVAADTGAA